MRIERKTTRRIRVGEVEVGGGAPISVQTMTSTDTRDAAATLAQVGRARKAGCDIVRVAVPDRESVEALPAILAGAGVPVIADIHFDHRLALAAVEAGVDGLRINPGNIGGEGRVREVARAAVAAGIPIRVGVNAGSLSKETLERHGGPTPQALVESALREVEWLEKYGCRDVKISVKASSVGTTVDAYRELSRSTGYPLHVGVSEAGPRWSGTIKSALGIGILLSEGIGDTIRVSLSADPVEEVRVGRKILSDLGLAPPGLQIISCPTCARTCIDVVELSNVLEERLADVRISLKVAVMGCAVNGPGEAREADVGIAGGRTRGLLFRAGEPVEWYPKGQLLQVLLSEIDKLTG
jgi:(E)-4-hydroxy-3-methylbut-2-enyl-diphosphate synthase